MLTQIELDAAPKITLAGKDYPVPFLVPRQQRIVIPKLMTLMKTFVGQDTGMVDPSNVTTEMYDDLTDMVFVGMSRGSPDLTREQFMDMPINLFELITAMNVIATQTGVLRRANAGEKPAGEAPAGD